jgi:hypothetical protein
MKRPTSNGDYFYCISAEELVQYKAGRLTGKRLEDVRHHLESCLLCLDALLHVQEVDEYEPVQEPSAQFVADLTQKVNRIAHEAWMDMWANK